MIITKDQALTQSIKNIWKKTYTLDDPRFIDFFFSSIYKPEYGYVNVEDNKAISAICRIKHPIVFNGRILQASILSGMCELPEYRKNGYIKDVLETVLDACEHTELITLARAENEDLLRSYGFYPLYQQNEFVLHRDDIKKIATLGCSKEVTPVDMLKVYSSFTKRFNGFIARDIDSFRNIQREVTARNGKVIGYYDDRKQIRGYIVVYNQGREAIISECIYLDSMTLIKLLNSAFQERDILHLYVSEAENLSVLFPNATLNVHDVLMARLNNPELFSRLFNKNIHNIVEAYSLSNKPLYLNEKY